MDENQLPSILSWLKNKFTGGPPESKGSTYLASPRLNYPTSEDVDFARKYDYSYGQPWAPEFENKSATFTTGSVPMLGAVPRAMMGSGGKEMPWGSDASSMKDYYAKAALAVEGNPLAKLGFDPTKFAANPIREPKGAGILGLYKPQSDTGYFLSKQPESLVHESIHRGIEKLSQSPFWNEKFSKFMGNPENEYTVRHLMETKMGDPEAAIDSWADVSKKQRDSARRMFSQGPLSDEYRNTLKEMEDAAANYIAAKRPGGPR